MSCGSGANDSEIGSIVGIVGLLRGDVSVAGSPEMGIELVLPRERVQFTKGARAPRATSEWTPMVWPLLVD
jgi:hypothetical protein